MPLLRVQGAPRGLTHVVIEGSASASLGPDVVAEFFFVVGKEVCCLLPRLFKRKTRVKETTSEINPLFLDVERFCPSYVESRKVLILEDTDTITKPLDFIKHTVEELDALLRELHRFALYTHRGGFQVCGRSGRRILAGVGKGAAEHSWGEKQVREPEVTKGVARVNCTFEIPMESVMFGGGAENQWRWTYSGGFVDVAVFGCSCCHSNHGLMDAANQPT